MTYAVAPLSCRPWALNGISARLIESHYEHTYGGDLHRLNAIGQAIAALEPSETPPAAVVGLKREELDLLNSVLLHSRPWPTG